jgi:hypothetical protein
VGQFMASALARDDILGGVCYTIPATFRAVRASPLNSVDPYRRIFSSFPVSAHTDPIPTCRPKTSITHSPVFLTAERRPTYIPRRTFSPRCGCICSCTSESHYTKVRPIPPAQASWCSQAKTKIKYRIWREWEILTSIPLCSICASACSARGAGAV